MTSTETSNSYDTWRGESPPSRFADEWECQQVVFRFIAHFDAGEYRPMERYFAPDGVWYQALGPIHGREELRQRMESLPSDQLMRHVLTNVRTTLVGLDEAVVDSYFTVYLAPRPETEDAVASTTGPRAVGRYRDSLSRRDGQWLICERQVTFDMKAPDS